MIPHWALFSLSSAGPEPEGTPTDRAIFPDSPSLSDIKARVDAETSAELALAQARVLTLSRIQASPARLNADQKQALAEAGGGGGRGPGRGGQWSDACTPLTDSQQAVINAMSSSLMPLNQAVAAAPRALTVATWGDKGVQTPIRNLDTGQRDLLFGCRRSIRSF